MKNENEREQPLPLPRLDGDINEPLCRNYRNTPALGAFKTVSNRVLEPRGLPVASAELCKGHINGGGVLERVRSMPKLASDSDITWCLQFAAGVSFPFLVSCYNLMEMCLSNL